MVLWVLGVPAVKCCRVKAVDMLPGLLRLPRAACYRETFGINTNKQWASDPLPADAQGAPAGEFAMMLALTKPAVIAGVVASRSAIDKLIRATCTPCGICPA